MNYADLLKKEDFAAQGIDLPASFALSALTKYINQPVRNKLLAILGKEKLESYVTWRTDTGDPDSESDTENTALHEVLNPFLCNVIWSQYWLQGNVQVTEAGPVTKDNINSEQLSDRQRTELRVFYENIAASCETKLRDFIDQDTVTPNPQTRTRVSVIKPRSKARFDDNNTINIRQWNDY